MKNDEGSKALEDVLVAATSRVDEIRGAAVRALAAIGRKDPRVGIVFERVAADTSEDAGTREFVRERLHWFRVPGA